MRTPFTPKLNVVIVSLVRLTILSVFLSDRLHSSSSYTSTLSWGSQGGVCYDSYMWVFICQTPVSQITRLAFAYVACVLWTRQSLCLCSLCGVVRWSTCAEYTWHATAKVFRTTDAEQSCWPWTRAAFYNYNAAAAAVMIEPEPIMTVSHNWAKTCFCRGPQRGSPLTSQFYGQNITLVYTKP